MRTVSCSRFPPPTFRETRNNGAQTSDSRKRRHRGPSISHSWAAGFGSGRRAARWLPNSRSPTSDHWTSRLPRKRTHGASTTDTSRTEPRNPGLPDCRVPDPAGFPFPARGPGSWTRRLGRARAHGRGRGSRLRSRRIESAALGVDLQRLLLVANDLRPRARRVSVRPHGDRVDPETECVCRSVCSNVLSIAARLERDTATVALGLSRESALRHGRVRHGAPRLGGDERGSPRSPVERRLPLL